MLKFRPFPVWVAAVAVVLGLGALGALAESWKPVRPSVRDRGAGGVTVTATWQGVEGGALVVRLSLDTHSVDLTGFDVAGSTVLRTEGGRELRPLRWEEEPGSSHHRRGLLYFPAPPSPPSWLQLVVRNLAGVPERVLVFEFGS